MASTTMDVPSAWGVLEGANLPRGYRVEITDGRILMTPRTVQQSDIVLSVAAQIDRRLEGGGVVLGDVIVDFPSTEYGYSPDLTVIAPTARRNRRGRFEWHSVDAILEVVPQSTRDGDFEKKVRHYAQCAIPVYVTIDPETSLCTMHTEPQRDRTYRDREEVPFGRDLVVPTSGNRNLVINTDSFPGSHDLD